MYTLITKSCFLTPYKIRSSKDIERPVFIFSAKGVMCVPGKTKKDMSSLVEKLQKALEHQKKGEMEPAEKIYRSVLKSQPQNLEILQMAAIFFNQIGNDHYAWTLLKKLINKKPSDCNVRRLAGQVLWALKDYNAAQDHLKKALALNPLDPQANLYMGLSYMATAQPLPAEPFLKSL